MERVKRIRDEKYERQKQTFAISVDVVMSGTSISESQLIKLWETASYLKAEDAAQILTACVSKNTSNATITTDASGAEVQFTTVLELLLAGQTIDSKQIELLSSISNRLTRPTIATVITKQLKVTYDARMAAQQVQNCSRFLGTCRISIHFSGEAGARTTLSREVHRSTSNYQPNGSRHFQRHAVASECSFHYFSCLGQRSA
jgi:hypothetical protein